ncbi:MAG TPA: hypothetical protein VJV78_04880 [Polyangiales bacterium]|nr:hypothetical protein [Polyangiales bacterium]
MRAFRLASWLCLLLMAAGPGGVRAQGGDASVATARALFEEGLRHVDAERWTQAADCFARLLELRYSPVAAYNLALARARLGENVRALNSLRELLAQPGLEATVREAAQSLQHEAEANVGWVTVHVRGSCASCGVQLDGQPWPAATPGVPVPVDPGHHALGLVRDDDVISSTDLTVAPGARLEASLVAEGEREPATELLPQTTATQQVSASTSASANIVFGQPSAPQEQSSSLFASPWFWGGVGVLAAGMVTLGVVLSSGGTQEASPVPGDFKPGVISGVVP